MKKLIMLVLASAVLTGFASLNAYYDEDGRYYRNGPVRNVVDASVDTSVAVAEAPGAVLGGLFGSPRRKNRVIRKQQKQLDEQNKEIQQLKKSK
jgi:hypothetical protein